MSYTDTKYIAKDTPLFQGEIVGNFNDPRGNAVLNNKLFWVSRNAPHAATYGKVWLYRPVRKLKLLKLTYRTVGKLLKDPSVNGNLKQLLLWTWGGQSPNNTFLNQFKSIIANENKYNTYVPTLYRYKHNIENYNNATGMIHQKKLNNWPLFKKPDGTLKRAGRFSRNVMNWNAYMKLKNQFSSSYDGLWSPHIRSPFHRIFPSEIVLFNARGALQRSEYSENNLQKNYQNAEARKAREAQVGYNRFHKKNTRTNNIGNFFGNK